MDSLFNILSDRNFDEPPEVLAIKKYVEDEFKSQVTVTAREKDVIVTVPNAALAGTLRMRSPDIKRRCQIEKKLIFRIG